MAIESKRVKKKTKYVRIYCDCCGIMHEYVSYTSINKACIAATKRGWDCSRYAPGAIYCPACVEQHGIRPITEQDRKAAQEAAPDDPYVGFDGYTNGTEPPKTNPKKKKPKPKCNNKRKSKRKKKGWVDYEKYIKSAAWRKKSKEWREAEGKCEICGATENLQCHHKHYKTLGHETREDVQVVCYKCHCKLHNVEDFDKKK